MILVTLGTQKEQFTRLLDYIENSKIEDEIIVQAGHTKYKSNKMKIFDFISYEDMEKYIDKADIIITHAGTGSVLTPLKKGKKIIACARLSKYNEHVDNHQVELVEAFKNEGYLMELAENDSLDEIIEKMKKFKPKKYKSNTINFIKKLSSNIDNEINKKNKKWWLFIVFLIVAVSIIFILKYLNINEKQLPVIYYHNIAYEEDIEKNEFDTSYTFSLETFEEEMKYLYDNGYKSINIQEFSCWKKRKCNLPDKAVMITFDDGCYSLKEYIEPILEKYELNAVAFIITDRLQDKTPKFDSSSIKYVGLDYVESTSDVFEFGSHSHGLHKRVNGTETDGIPIASTMTEKTLLKDLNTSYNIVQSKVFAYPFTYYDRDLIHALKKSKYEYAFRIHNKKTYQNESNYLISRIGDTSNFESFKQIFEGKIYNQTILDKIKGIWVKIKYF